MSVHQKTGAIKVSWTGYDWQWCQENNSGSKREMPLNFFAKEIDTGVEVIIITTMRYQGGVGMLPSPSAYNAKTLSRLNVYRDAPKEKGHDNSIWYEVDLQRAYQNN